jgi:hypothetical protein
LAALFASTVTSAAAALAVASTALGAASRVSGLGMWAAGVLTVASEDKAAAANGPGVAAMKGGGWATAVGADGPTVAVGVVYVADLWPSFGSTRA